MPDFRSEGVEEKKEWRLTEIENNGICFRKSRSLEIEVEIEGKSRKNKSPF